MRDYNGRTVLSLGIADDGLVADGNQFMCHKPISASEDMENIRNLLSWADLSRWLLAGFHLTCVLF